MEKKERKKSTFFADFKKFITKGNVIDMAVGVVVGGSFSKIVSGLVNYIINPFVAIFVKSGSLDSIKTVITPEVVDAEGVVTTAEVAILWGTWVQTIIDFLITAFCIFLVLRIIMRAKNKLEEEKIAAAAEKAAVEAAQAEEQKKAAEEAAAALAARQRMLEDSQLHQEKLLEEICRKLDNRS